MRRLLSDARFRLGSCVLALAALAGIAVVTHTPAPAAPASAAEPAARTLVNRMALSCPAPGTGGKVQTVVSAIAPILPPGTPTAAGDTAPLTIAPLAATADPVGSLLVRGRLISTPRSSKLDPLMVRGAGPLAAGTVGTATSTASEGVNRGMASVPCQPPGSEFWFVGASTAAGRRDVLVLTNLDSVNAQADVSVYSSSGPQEVPAARGVVVPARGTAEVFLSTVMPKLADVALRVVSTGGRVSAAVRDNATKGASTPAGVDWLNSSALPATKVVVPALAPGAGARMLSVVNPGDLQATATITVNGRNGPFKPAGRASLVIPAGGVKTVAIDPVLRGEPTAVTVESDQPLTASARTVDAGGKDFASIGATDPLAGPGYLALPPHKSPMVLQLTAAGKSAAVRLEVRDAGGKVVDNREVPVPAGATASVVLRPQAMASYLMVAPQRGDVVAGVTLMTPGSGDDGAAQVAAWPLTTSTVFRAQLGAAPDVGAALK